MAAAPGRGPQRLGELRIPGAVGYDVGDGPLAGGELSVRDHGPGIAAADLPHVFDRFYRATRARSVPGSGLGLAIVRQVTHAHSGTIIAEAPADGGTRMRLRLPADDRAL